MSTALEEQSANKSLNILEEKVSNKNLQKQDLILPSTSSLAKKVGEKVIEKFKLPLLKESTLKTPSIKP